jgi:hypothetical protein
MTGLLGQPVFNDCECGRPRSPKHDACDRCRFLDGERLAHQEIISALRDVNGMSISELCRHIYGSYDSSNNGTSMMRVLRKMQERGRVSRFWRDGDCLEFKTSRWGNVQMTRGRAVGAWVYQLADRGVP